MSATCPKHGIELQGIGMGVLACPEPKCQYATTIMAVQDKRDRSKREAQPTKQKVYEKDLQIEVKSNLEMRGYEVLEVGKGRAPVTCSKCGTKTYGNHWQGNDEGVPDLQIRGKNWPVGIWLDIELKGSETVVRPKQQELADRGGSYICRSWEEVWSKVQETEGRLGV